MAFYSKKKKKNHHTDSQTWVQSYDGEMDAESGPGWTNCLEQWGLHSTREFEIETPSPVGDQEQWVMQKNKIKQIKNNNKAWVA